jgi:malate dehydrogenase (oxaloacetate-decarboxylating)
MSTIDEEALALHKKYTGKISVDALVKVASKHDLSLLYTPGVAQPCRQIAKDKQLSFDLTWRGRTVAVLSNGTAVLGLGNIGPEAAIPVMEGKALLLKKFGGVDAVPIVVNAQDATELILFTKQIAPSFAGILLEDIAAPVCFQVEDALQDLGIPVFHDDQHGTAIVCKAGLKNAAKVVGKKYDDLRVVIVGAGAAGLATAKMLLGYTCTSDNCQRIPGQSRVKEVIVVDRTGAVYQGREHLNIYKQLIAGITNQSLMKGSLEEVIKNTDAVIGVSGPGLITKHMVKSMAYKPIVIAMANPIPEIMPDDALSAGATVVASGRSDYPNQINNLLAFPGIFQAVIKGRLSKITQEMKNAAADALAGYIDKPDNQHILPDVFAPGLAEHIAKAVLRAKRN